MNQCDPQPGDVGYAAFIKRMTEIAEYYENQAFPPPPPQKVRRTRRARRRHALKLTKARVRRIIKNQDKMINKSSSEPDPKRVGRMAQTMVPCSGFCCGNPRHHWKNAITKQEKLASLKMDEMYDRQD